MDLQNKIQAVIKENLTTAQTGLLQEYFTLFAQNEKELEGLRNYKKNTEEMLKELTKERDTLRAEKQQTLEMHKTALNLAGEVAKARQELDLKIAQANLEACKQSYAEMKDLMATVFRNPKFVHTQEHSEYHQGYSAPNGWVSDHTVNKTYKTSTEQE